MNRNDRKRIWLTVFLTCIGLYFCLWSLIDYYRAGYESQSKYDSLSAMLQTLPPETVPESQPQGSQILPEYQVLLDWNPDFAGWLEIEGTTVNYPVVQTPEDPEAYLYRHFDGTESSRGCIFADGACDIDRSDNITLYGHNMRDGTMFADLTRYESYKFYEAHPVIRFDSLTRHRSYRIFAVFRTTAIAGEGFAYHKFVDAADEAAFNAFIDRCLALSLYSTDIVPQYGDQVICLSTCESYEAHERFVVAAVLMDE